MKKQKPSQRNHVQQHHTTQKRHGLLTASLLSFSVMVLTPFVHAADKALIIGIGSYADPAADLQGIDIDVEMMSDVAQYLGFTENNTTYLQDDEATLANVTTALKTLASEVNKDDRVLVYYSGHGSNKPDTNGDEADKLDESLYLYDGKHLLDDELNTLLRAIPSDNMVVVFDSCHSGSAVRDIAYETGNAMGIKQAQQKFYGGFDPEHMSKAVGQENKVTVKPAVPVADFLNDDAANPIDFLAIGAAQDSEKAVSTYKGSMFTHSLYQAFHTARQKKQTITWQQLFNNARANLRMVTTDFSPRIDGEKVIAAKQQPFINITQQNIADKPLWASTQQAVLKGSAVTKDISTAKTPLFRINAPKSVTIGKPVQLSVTVPSNGYLNVVAVTPEDNAIILFPNKDVQSSKVHRGKIAIPSKDRNIPASGPIGDTLVAAFFSREAINLRDARGMGHLDQNGRQVGWFSNMSSGGYTVFDAATKQAGKAQVSNKISYQATTATIKVTKQTTP